MLWSQTLTLWTMKSGKASLGKGLGSGIIIGENESDSILDLFLLLQPLYFVACA